MCGKFGRCLNYVYAKISLQHGNHESVPPRTVPSPGPKSPPAPPQVHPVTHRSPVVHPVPPLAVPSKNKSPDIFKRRAAPSILQGHLRRGWVQLGECVGHGSALVPRPQRWVVWSSAPVESKIKSDIYIFKQ